MQVQTNPYMLQAEALARRAKTQRVGLVPTMGFLHRGHTSLFDLARKHCDWLVASIYVNPLQFAPGEDLENYPRDLDGDAAKCRAHGVDCLFLPDTLYASNHSTNVTVSELNAGLCGASRPTHFGGVTTVVARLFGLVQPNIAVFGEKDYQQLAIIRRMVQDLAMPIEILGGPLIRDTDGLALSSRNTYLNAEQRKRAATIHTALKTMQSLVDSGLRDVEQIVNKALSILDVDRLDYLEVRDGLSLKRQHTVERGSRAFVAAWVGTPRLIDNLEILK